MRSQHLITRIGCLIFFISIGVHPHFAEAQTMLGPGDAGGNPARPGDLIGPGQTATYYFFGHTGVSTLDASQSVYDAVVWSSRLEPVPPNWIEGFGGTAGQCLPGKGDAGGISIRTPLPVGNTIVSSTWGTYCFDRREWATRFHFFGQPNGPTFLPPLPVQFKTPGDENTCAGDPCDTKTGLYYQTDIDMEVPDVMPITLTRTYRTEDTGTRVFGIGASHGYGQYMLRDDLCSVVRIVMPDGSYREFTRTSGTNCLDSTLQHTTTQTAFYGATFMWDQSLERYRLKLKDGTEWRFSDYGWLVAMLDRNGNTLTLSRAKADGLAGNLTKITTPNGRYLTFTYDTSNRITQVTDILGRTIIYTYDANGNLWKVTNPLSGVSEYTYDASHRLLTAKEPNGNTHVTNVYDANGRVQTQTQADSTTYQFAYTLDGSGNVTQTDVTDPRGFVKRLSFNSAGLTTTVIDALGQPEAQSTTYEWQAGTNLLLSVTDTLSRKTAYTYDSKGNVLRVTRLATTPNAVTTTFTYEPAYSQIATVTDPLSHTTTFGYDIKGNLTTITNALNKTTTLTVNGQGQPLTIKDPLNNTTTLTYELGDLISVKDPLNRETKRMLDAAGRLRSLINPLGQKTVYTLDALDRITQLTDAINGVTQFGYDANSNLLTVTDTKSQQTVYTYSNMNRTSTRKDPLLNTETYTYDNNGNLATVTDRKSQTTTYTYDPLNRRTKATFQDGTSTNYTYDAGNRITQVQEKNAGGTVTATITRTYDGLDRLTQEVTPQGQIDYTYDAASRRTSMTVQGQSGVNYTYDNANRLTQITKGSDTVTIAYDEADRRTSLTYPNGNKIEYAYNAASEVTSLTYKSGSTTIGDLTYTYDAAGSRIKVGGTFARSNLPLALTATSYNANNQQTAFGTTTATYDLNGNLATVTQGGNTTTYTWNARNQLTSISRTGLTASFTYDSFGRRTGKTINGTTTNFLYDGLNPVQEKNGATVTANLMTGLGIDEFFTRTDGVGVRALLSDALGSTIALGDGTGTLQTQYTYEPFGFTTQTGSASTSSYKYTGREDDDTGLAYYQARYYQPRFQRFIAEDPIGFVGGDLNLYGYTFNSPSLLRDPYGLIPPTVLTGAGVGLIFGGVGALTGALARNVTDPYALATIVGAGALLGAGQGALLGAGLVNPALIGSLAALTNNVVTQSVTGCRGQPISFGSALGATLGGGAGQAVRAAAQSMLAGATPIGGTTMPSLVTNAIGSAITTAPAVGFPFSLSNLGQQISAP